MSKNDEKTTNGAIGSFYKVNYSFIHSNGAIRQGAVAVEAKNATEAKEKAAPVIAESNANARGVRITGAKLY